MYGEAPERQGRYFGTLLTFAKEIEIEDKNGDIRTQKITYGSYTDTQERYVFKKIKDNISYLKLMDFDDEEQIRQLIKDSDEQIINSKYLIIDVRKNDGGANTAYYPIYRYALPEGKKLSDVQHPVTYSQINYSERNVANRLEFFEEYEKQELPDETKEIINILKKELMKNRGKGLVDLPEEEFELEEVGVATPERIIILTDCDCGSAGDMFVKEIGALDKVTVIGRPTMGIMDYADIAEISYDKFTLIYPTSRDKAVDEGKGMCQKGVAVDRYIPWTPEHITRDVDLCEALKILGEN